MTTRQLDETLVAGSGDVIAERPESARPEGPRPEIWFKRKIGLRGAVRDMWRYRELVVTLAERDLRVRYKQALLGFAWALFTPVMLMLVFSFVFTKFAHIKTPAGVPYPLFSFMGLLPWTFFSSSVLGGGNSLITNMPILNKVYCPREVFPLAALVVAAIDTAVATVVLSVLFAVEGFAPKLETFYAPLLLAVMVAFTLGVALIISSLLVYLRDLRHILPLILQFALFATPVAYGIEAIVHSKARLLMYSAVNPLAPVIDGLRRTVLLGAAPRWDAFLVGAVSSAVVLSFGYWLFKRLEAGIADIA
jgi:ABC-type polysaccharide/polyol phosphate export permease